MISSVNVINEEGNEVKIDVIMQFKIEELDREYVIYTLNDDGKSEDVYVSIAGIENNNGQYKLKLIPEQEKNMVLIFYDNIRDTICGKR